MSSPLLDLPDELIMKVFQELGNPHIDRKN